jgi:3-oxoacyl-[acyl-carrier-protein] synthase II
MMPSRQRVAITGYGALSALGHNVPLIWEGVREQRLGYRRHALADPRIRARFFGFLEDEAEARRLASAGFPKGLVRKLALFARHALRASHEALVQAFGSLRPLGHYSPFECGVIIGTGWGGLDSANMNSESYRKTQLASPFTTLMSMNSAATAAVSQCFGLRGYQGTPVAACASGAIAIGEAAEVIRRGASRCMLAGGSESIKELFNLWSIDILDALSKEHEDPRRACCPFSLDRSGFVLAEGAAVVCLEQWEGAVSRGASILGEVTGYGNFADAHDLTAPAPDQKARVHAIQAALRDAGREPSEIDYVNAHGTSTPLNDRDESDALKLALGEHARRVPISSTKSYTGHLIGAAGALEAILCLKAIEERMVPATIHLSRPDPLCDLDYTPNQHRAAERLDVCLNLSFGFGGANAALVLERAR